MPFSIKPSWFNLSYNLPTKLSLSFLSVIFLAILSPKAWPNVIDNKTIVATNPISSANAPVAPNTLAPQAVPKPATILATTICPILSGSTPSRIFSINSDINQVTESPTTNPDKANCNLFNTWSLRLISSKLGINILKAEPIFHPSIAPPILSTVSSISCNVTLPSPLPIKSINLPAFSAHNNILSAISWALLLILSIKLS